MSVIVFEASVYKVQTLSDHGIRVTLDLSEDLVPQMAMLAEAQRQGIPLTFEAKLDEPQKRKRNGDGKQRSKDG